MTAEACVLYTFVVLIAGAVLAIALSRRRRLCAWIAAVSIGAALLCTARAAITMAARGQPVQFTVFSLGFLRSSLAVQFDALSALLSMLVLIIGLICAFYAARYIEHLQTRTIFGFWPSYLTLLAAMYGLLSMADLLFFIVFWEFMSLPAYALIVHRKRQQESLRAGIKYLIITHIANIGFFVAALLIYRHCQSFAFADIQLGFASMAAARPWLSNLIIGLVVLVFATKAGLFPVGDWAPDAYGAAPAPASAMLSGVMSKMAAFGLIRLGFWMLPVAALPQSWLIGWGIVIAGWGAISALAGSTAAIVSDDSKHLLGYSSVSQSGYIFTAIGVGFGLFATSALIAAVALIAALLHIIADAAHKAVLFLTSGSIFQQTGMRDLNQLGGLMGSMPSTALAALIGVLSLAGMPLTGAFASKWLIFQSGLFAGLENAAFAACVVVGLVASVMGIAYGLKYFGAIFLGTCPEDVQQQKPQEMPFTEKLVQLLLAAVCILLGVLPMVPIGWSRAALLHVTGHMPDAAFQQASLWEIATRLGVAAGVHETAIFAPLWVAGLLIVCIIIAWGLSRMGGAPVRHVAGWVCGEAVDPQLTRVQAHSYFPVAAEKLKNIYPQVGLPKIKLPEKRPRILDIDAWGFHRIAAGSRKFAAWLGNLHTGVPQSYMLWQAVGAALVIGVLWLAIQAVG